MPFAGLSASGINIALSHLSSFVHSPPPADAQSPFSMTSPPLFVYVNHNHPYSPVEIPLFCELFLTTAVQMPLL